MIGDVRLYMVVSVKERLIEITRMRKVCLFVAFIDMEKACIDGTEKNC